jgi:hypothetical protein
MSFCGEKNKVKNSYHPTLLQGVSLSCKKCQPFAPVVRLTIFYVLCANVFTHDWTRCAMFSHGTQYNGQQIDHWIFLLFNILTGVTFLHENMAF